MDDPYDDILNNDYSNEDGATSDDSDSSRDDLGSISGIIDEAAKDEEDTILSDKIDFDEKSKKNSEDDEEQEENED